VSAEGASAERDFLAFAVELEGIAGGEMQLLAESLRNEDTSSTIEGKLRCHSGTIVWENPLVKPIVT
jgi:hypothetical protein